MGCDVYCWHYLELAQERREWAGDGAEAGVEQMMGCCSGYVLA